MVRQYYIRYILQNVGGAYRCGALKGSNMVCTLSKIMEGIIHENVILHVQVCNILNSSQHGFLANRSTSSQSLACIYDWCSAIKLGHVTNAVYIDFKKAFNPM